jgi:4'-phosphopantetheinyl transferase
MADIAGTDHSAEGRMDLEEGFRERLGRDEIHLWTTVPETIADPALLDAYAALESADERERRLRMRVAGRRHESLVSVALVRTTLARYAGVEARAWEFERNAYGRPELAPGQCDSPLRFNLSHTQGLIVCAVTLERDIGVDVECTGRRSRTVAVADRFFSAGEAQDLHALPAGRRRDRFFEYWTLKESYVKARGLGLKIPLRRFSFHLDAGRAIRVSFDRQLEDAAQDWQFELLRPRPKHVVAVAVRRGADPDLKLRVRPTVPLGDSVAKGTSRASRE